MRYSIIKTFSLLLALFALAACEDNTPDSIINDSPLDFEAPVVGQKAYFQRYTSTCGNIDVDFALTGDTLVVELISDGDEFYLQENFTVSSPLFNEGNIDPIRHKITFKDDYALIPQRGSSALFFFYGNDTIRFKPSQREPMTQNACRIDFNDQIFTGDEIGNINSFQIGPLVEANKTVVSCIPIGFNIDAYLIYDENKLLMSHTVDFQGSISGWSYID